jgi:hypothetical protein
MEAAMRLFPGVAAVLALMIQPSMASVQYQFVTTTPAQFDQTFMVTDAAYAHGSMDLDTWCLGASLCRLTALTSGWVSGFGFPDTQARGRASLVFTGALATGWIDVQLTSDYEFVYQGSGLDWTALVTASGQPIYQATGYFLDAPPSSLPEPAGLGLLVMGMLGLGAARRYGS